MTTALAYLGGGAMVTALGLDLASSCAAARAGIRRAKEIKRFPLTSLEEGADVFPIGHEIEALAKGFEGKARLLTLLTAALEDLERQSLHDGNSSAPFYLAVPSNRRIYQDLDLVERDAWREDREEEGASVEAEPPGELAEWLLARAYRSLKRQYVPAIRGAATGRMGFALCLQAALRDMASGAVDRVVVGGVDSLLDEETLKWLHHTARLKYVDMPVGIEPAEGAGLVVLERYAPAASPRVAVLAAHVEPPRSGPYATLAAAIREASGRAGILGPEWLIADVDGTEARANELGHAMVRLRTEGRGLPSTTYPAASFGDTGAAFGALSTGVALRAFARRVAPSRGAMIVCGDRGAGYAAHVIQEA